MLLEEKISRIQSLMGLSNNFKNILKESIDPGKIKNLVLKFLVAEDEFAKKSALKTYYNLAAEERKVFDDFIVKYSDEISPGTKLNNITDLLKVAKLSELVNLSRLIGNNLNELSNTLKKNNIDYSKYVNLQNLQKIEPINQLKTIKDLISQEPRFKKIFEALNNNRPISEIDRLDSFELVQRLDAARRLKDLPDDIQGSFDELFNEYYEIHNKITNSDLNDLNYFARDANEKSDELLNPQQVAGLKVPEDQLKIIDDAIAEKGFDKPWPIDPNTGEPTFIEITIGNKKYKYTLADTEGPYVANWDAINQDGLWPKFYSEYVNSGNKTWASFLGEKFKNDKQLFDKYFKRYEIQGGVKIRDTSTPNGIGWIITNPTRGSSVVGPMKAKDLRFIDYHEIAHGAQEGKLTKSTYQNTTYRTKKLEPDSALDLLFGKTEYNFKDNEGISLRWDDFYGKENVNPEVDKIFDEFKTEKGKEWNQDWETYQEFQRWAYDNNKIDQKYFDIVKVPSEKNFKTNYYSLDVKKRTMNLLLDKYLTYETWDKTKINKIKTTIAKLDGAQLEQYLKNNINDGYIRELIKDTQYQLTYLLSRTEMEVDFTAALRTILDVGTEKENIGFASWLIDYLKAGNKLEILKPKSPQEVKKSLIDYFFNFFKKNPQESQNTNNFIDKLPPRLFDFLYELEKDYKTVYPDDALKMYKGLYKQAYELVSKGFPSIALLFTTNELLDDNSESTEQPQTSMNESQKINEFLKLSKIFEY